MTSTNAASAFEQLIIKNPATDEPAGIVEVTPSYAVEQCAQRARHAQQEWADAPWTLRAQVIKRFHDLLFERQDEILDVIQSESGKSRRDALTELVTVAGTARYYLSHGRAHIATRRARAGIPLLTKARTSWHPHGLVGLITPWNFPFLLGVGDALPALLAGNAVLTKPSELTPLSTILARDLLVQAGLHNDLFQPLIGLGPELGPPLIAEVDYIGFTGSTKTGQVIAAAAAERLIPCSLELGGKNAMIVLPGGNIKDAALGLLSGAFANSGQTCICVERAYVHEDIWDEFIALAKELTSALQVRWSTDFDTDMGSLINIDHAHKVRGHIQDAIDKGATIIAGGLDIDSENHDSAFVAPTLLTDVTESMELFADETFGPVVSLVKVASTQEAVKLANNSKFGLNGSIWGGKRKNARKIASSLDVGSVNINSTLLVYNSFDVPMGGIRWSGLGSRHSATGIQRYCRQLSVVESFARGGGYELLLRMMTSTSRAKLLLSAIKLWRHVPWLRQH